ncbi:MAG TPA: MOSC domain-containing protein [Candidatus Limnocylindrales bacterium]|nr:MOSC domain-containing protein [Candidatus Limnocylindrales bacterium]
MATVSRLNVTPVKGTRLQHPPAVELTRLGIVGNRRFHFVDAHGDLASCTDVGAVMRLTSAWDAATETIAIDFPDGSRVEAAADRLGAAHVTDFDGRPVPGRFVGGQIDQAVSAFTGRALRLIRADVEGDGPDVHRLSLLGLASVKDLGARHGRPDLDPSRFRMNLELDGTEPYEEDTWTGRAVRIGGAVIRVLGQVPRCVATTRDPATGEKDFDTLKHIAACRPLMTEPRGIPFGMYAEVEVPGRVAPGDPVTPLD